MRQKAHWSILLLLVLLAACKQPGFYQTLGDAITPPVPLKIAPASLALDVGKSAGFTASGGDTPYAYSIVSGPGTVDVATGAFVAAAAGTTVIRVTDKKGSTSDATVTISPLVVVPPPPVIPLAVGPSSASVNPSGSIGFVATGGTPPYTFSFGVPLMSGPTITAAGIYTAGTTAGTDRVVVTDSSVPPLSVHADVIVTTSASNVNYALSSVGLTNTGRGGELITAGGSFRIANIGLADGTKLISYWVYLSDSNGASPNSPDTVLLDSSSSVPSQIAGGSVDITLAGQWPLVPLVPPQKYLWVQISASDDLIATDNLTNLQTVNLLPAAVDYQPSSVTNTGGIVAGAPLAGSFLLTNIGSDPGSETVHWTAYVSTVPGATIDGTSVVIDSGSHTFLAAGAPSAVTVTFGGTWPSTAGIPYYLKVKVAAADDTNSTDDVGATSGITTTQVNYKNAVVLSAIGSYANNSFNGQLSYDSAGTADGIQPVTWKVWLSADTVLDVGDTLIATGTDLPPPLHGTTSVPIPYSGVWPATPGTWYLIASVSCPEDKVPGDDVGLTVLMAVTTAPVINYAMVSVGPPTGSILPGGIFNSDFTFQNTLPLNGAQTVAWRAYASTTGAIDGSEILVSSGFVNALAASATSTPIPINGPWPLHYGDYHLIVQISSPEDSIGIDNTLVTGITTVGTVDESIAGTNDDVATLSNATPLGVTLRPGMSVHVKGTLNAGDPVDVLRFNTGTTTSVSAYMSWAFPGDVTLYFMSAGGVFAANASVSLGTTVSLGWVHAVAAPGSDRWIAVSNPFLENVGNYDLILTGN
jgi:hypothetical protein